MKQIVDISNLNGNVDLQIFKSAGYKGIVAKVSEGETFVDRLWGQNYGNARALNLMVGLYHFARFKNKAKAIREANFFVSLIQNISPNFVVLDFQQDCSGDVTDVCLAFLDSIFL
ncbi:glycoside hydrolase family 25 protein [Clostridium kluyveri]|uniref:Lysozyme n=1 Tax=Clostridium kluyveri TaxID=1534 RepID=A0A1L5F4J4_CLOKL|nr:glycoside hydrolase family 25 protein [Clostridium kluyveri]APM37939.1 hypothetical protein BS101_03905 [Clostridium kluyveri]UZQ52052.1 glycoside hydrolase family 25 protein [Clostridium kluyveri]